MKTDVPGPEVVPALAKLVELLRPEELNELQEFGQHAVYTPYLTAFLMIVQRLRGNATLDHTVAELRENPAWAAQHPRLQSGRLSANTGAFSRARTRLQAEVAEGFADRIFDSLQACLPPSWHDRRVWILDGTTLSLSSRAALREAFPPASNQHGSSVWPIMQCVVAHDLASGCALRPEVGTMYGSKSVGEVALAKQLLTRLPPRSLLLADRNFGVFGFVYAATRARHDTLTRLTQKRFQSLVRKARALGEGQWELDWKPTAADRKTHPELPADAQVRIYLYAVPGHDEQGQAMTLWLATTLPLTVAEAGELYRQRQHVETDIRDVKSALKFRELRGQSVEMLRKELALGIVAYNLVVQVRRLAAARGGVSPRRLSFTGSLTLVQSLLLYPAYDSEAAYTAQFEGVLRGCLQRAVPKRSGRSYPRKKLPRRQEFPYRKATPEAPPAK